MTIDLQGAAEDYLRLRRSLGFKLVRHQPLLDEFIAWLGANGHSMFTTDLALRWACLPPTGPGPWWAQRLRTVRGFASYLRVLDPAVPVPPAGLIGPQGSRAEPFIYTPDEIGRLLDAVSANNRDLHKRSTFVTLFGLLAVTGMRLGEVIGLDDTDVNADDATVLIRGAKFNKTREIPLHRSTLAAIATHQHLRDRSVTATTPALFVSRTGNRTRADLVQHDWTNALRTAGITARSPRCRPRMHDLRHTFAVTTLESWLATGADLDALLPRLSTYLGHNNPGSTYWYLTATPSLLHHAARQLEAARP